MPTKEYKITKSSFLARYEKLSCSSCNGFFKIDDTVVTHSTNNDYFTYHKRCWDELFY